MYRAVTQDIEVVAEPFYMEERSSPAEGRHFWAYRITIVNHSRQPVRLLERYWRITDETGHVEEVRGPGVVGEQPLLGPGDSYQYTSGCPLDAPSGIMVGRYLMEDPQGRRFEIDIPAFSLDLPGRRTVVN